ncbi:hypothetical protein TIFTF001_014267 [Ficus carica]|uniref:Uncharacterized protein n=1 Tax=Ficus carica TaxID=3494 RepID=A0AA87ZZ75_FICCA|nr:hypothetical protein TIFTF001_014267 [Ficus carica]
MSGSCLPSMLPLMPPPSSSPQPTTSPLPSPPLGFGENVRQESTENIEDLREDEGDEEINGSIENSSDEEVDKEDHDVSRMILTSELQELPPLILSEYFSAKVTSDRE